MKLICIVCELDRSNRLVGGAVEDLAGTIAAVRDHDPIQVWDERDTLRLVESSIDAVNFPAAVDV
jgi:hypothetical protein